MRDQSHEAVYLAFILTRFVVALGPSGSRFGSPNTQTIQRHALQDRVARRRSAGRHCFLGIEWIQPEKKEKRRQPWNPLYCNGHYRYSPKWLVPCFYCAIYDRSLVVRVVFSGSWYRDLRSCSVMRFFRKKESVDSIIVSMSNPMQVFPKYRALSRSLKQEDREFSIQFKISIPRQRWRAKTHENNAKRCISTFYKKIFK